MLLPKRSGAFVNKEKSDQYLTQVSERLCGCVAVLPKLWPGKRHRLNRKTLREAWYPTKNDQAHAQILSVVKLTGESEVVRPIVADAKYPVLEYPLSAEVKASKIIQDLTYTSVANGDTGVSVVYVDPEGSGALSVAVTGKKITVTLAHDGDDITSTATLIKDAVDGEPTAAALATVAISGTGSNVQVAQVETFLELAWSQLGVEYTTNPWETAISATKAIKFFATDGRQGDDLGLKIASKDAAKKQFVLHIAQLSDAAVWVDTPGSPYTLSVLSTGQYSVDAYGDSIFAESVLEMKEELIQCKVDEAMSMDDIPVMADYLAFSAGVLGIAPTADELQAAADVLTAGGAKEFYAAGQMDTTFLTYAGVKAKASRARFSRDLPLNSSVSAAITARDGYTTSDISCPYFNPIQIDDPSGIGRMWIGHSGHAAALASLGFSNAELKTAEAIAGVPWGGINIYNNVKLYHDSLTDTQLNDLATAKINVCVPAPPNTGSPVCFNDQWTMANVESDDQLRHVQATHDLIGDEAFVYFNAKVHRSTKEVEDSIELFTNAYLEPKERLGMLVPVPVKEFPAYEITYAEDEFNSGVYLIYITIVVVQSNRQILITTKTRR
jgi:hypothetical protein